METKYVVVERIFRGRYVALRNKSWSTEAEAKAYIEATYQERFRNRFHVESRTVKADDSSLRMTCQCCGRDILANTGRIALHGYERPGWGYQTASCMGAQHLPFEVSRDRLGDMIDMMIKQRDVMIEARAEIEAETAEIVHVIKARAKWGRAEEVKATLKITRANFAELKAQHSGHFMMRSMYDFDGLKANELRHRDHQIEMINADIKAQQKRFASWTKTHERRGDQWVTKAAA